MYVETRQPGRFSEVWGLAVGGFRGVEFKVKFSVWEQAWSGTGLWEGTGEVVCWMQLHLGVYT